MDLLRRKLLCLLAAAAATPALAQSGRPKRIGYVDNTIPLAQLASVPREVHTQVFVDALRDLGWVEGRNLEILWRSAEGVAERRRGIFEDLVRARVEAILVFGTLATREAMSVTRTVPIVMVSSGDVSSQGVVSSIVRPGGNVTGVSQWVSGSTLGTKRLDILKRALRQVSHLAYLNPGQDFTFAPQFARAAESLGIKLSIVRFGSIGELDAGIAEAKRGGVDALYMLPYMFFDDPRHHDGIRAVIERHRLPLMAGHLRTNLGAILNYAADGRPGHASAARYVDKILRGAKPGDLAIEQPRAFQLIVNLRAAKAIGVAIAPAIVAQADRVIE